MSPYTNSLAQPYSDRKQRKVMRERSFTMSVDHYYRLCNKNIGVPVEIRCHDGKTHVGVIDRVDHEKVYLKPLDGYSRGPGVFFWGFGAGLLIGIPLGAIATLAFLPWGYW